MKKSSLTAREMENSFTRLNDEYRISAQKANMPKRNNLLFKNKTYSPPEGITKPQNIIPLSKASVYQEIIGIKSTMVNLQRPFLECYDVAPYQTISVSVSSNYYFVDPFLVIYQVTNGDPTTDYYLQQNLAVLSYNDDYNGLCPSASWYNPNSTSAKVWVLVFAYSEYGSGSANINFTMNGQSWTSPISVTSCAMFYDNSLLNGAGYHYDYIPTNWSFYLPGKIAFGTTPIFTVDGFPFGSKAPFCTGDSYIWAFNFNEMKGVANDDYEGGNLGSGTSTLTDWMTFPTGYHYPNVILLGGYSSYGTAQLLEIAPIQY